jgi:hypothetical protein
MANSVADGFHRLGRKIFKRMWEGTDARINLHAMAEMRTWPTKLKNAQ